MPPPLCGGATEERSAAAQGATDDGGADEVDTIIKGGKQRGKQSQEFRLSIPAPFRFAFAARIFRLRLPSYKMWNRDDFGTGERERVRLDVFLEGGASGANCQRFHRKKSQNTGG